MEVSTRFNIGDYVYYLTPSGIRKSEIIHITITEKSARYIRREAG